MIKPDTSEASSPALPMAAMIDMVFLMIFYFLACGTLQSEQPAANVAFASTVEAGASEGAQQVVVLGNGHLLLDGIDCGAGRSGVARLGSLLARPDAAAQPVIVRPDPGASHGSVTAAMSACARAGRQGVLE